VDFPCFHHAKQEQLLLMLHKTEDSPTNYTYISMYPYDFQYIPIFCPTQKQEADKERNLASSSS